MQIPPGTGCTPTSDNTATGPDAALYFDYISVQLLPTTNNEDILQPLVAYHNRQISTQVT